MSKTKLTKKESSCLTLDERLIFLYRKYPVYACEELLHVKLNWYERRILRDAWDKPFVLLNMGRGCAKTFMVAVYFALRAMLYPKLKMGVVGPSFRQSTYTFEKLTDLWNGSEYLRAATLKEPVCTTIYAHLKFKNRSIIQGLPLGDGGKIRGARFHIVFLDEVKDTPLLVIQKVVRPFLNVKYSGPISNQLISASNAGPKWNHFYWQWIYHSVMAQKKPDKYAVHNYNVYDAFQDTESDFQLDREMIEMQMADMDEFTLLTEMFSVFPDEVEAFFPTKLVEGCVRRITPVKLELEGKSGGTYVLGVDTARSATGSNFVIIVLRIFNPNKIVMVHSFVKKGATLNEMVDAIRQCCIRFDVSRIFMDARGGGDIVKDGLNDTYRDFTTGKDYPPIVDPELEDKEGREVPKDALKILRMIPPTAPMVNEMYHRLKAYMESKKIAFPLAAEVAGTEKGWDKEGTEMYEELMSEVRRTKTELVNLKADPSSHGYKFYSASKKIKDDRAFALGLANMAAHDFLTRTEDVETPIDWGVGKWLV